MKVCDLKYNYDLKRWGIFDRNEWRWIDEGLHCGDCFTILNREGKVDVRIEFSDDWYIVGTKKPYKGWELEGLGVVVP